jgi:hypothetical protein
VKTRTRLTTIGLANNAGPLVKVHEFHDMGAEKDLEAWIGNFGSSNVYVFEGELSLAQCEARVKVAEVGAIDCILALTEAGPIRGSLEDNARRVTVYFEAKNESGQTQAVCLKIYEYYTD